MLDEDALEDVDVVEMEDEVDGTEVVKTELVVGSGTTEVVVGSGTTYVDVEDEEDDQDDEYEDTDEDKEVDEGTTTSVVVEVEVHDGWGY